MIVNRIFAQILDNYIKNIIVCDNYELANQLARMAYGDNAVAYECTQYPVSIGDKYIDGVFYFKDGITPVPKVNTAEEDIVEARAELATTKEQLNQTTITLDTLLTEIIPALMGAV
jgi:hypothetical protein